MATTTLLAKARQRRMDALASLTSGKSSRDDDRHISIFDGVFASPDELHVAMTRNNVIAFRSGRARLVAALDPTAPERIAA